MTTPNSAQGARQECVRALTGTTLDYNGDWLSLFTQSAIPAGDFNGRMLAWINGKLSTTYPDVSGAMSAFAIANGAKTWDGMGAFS